MGCVLCRRRQVDPSRGPSPWRRGVVLRDGRTEQVLVCPDCSAGPDWTDVLARCADCGSTSLLVRLGEPTCRDCGGHRATAGPRAPDAPDEQHRTTLGDDVAAAIERVLGRG